MWTTTNIGEAAPGVATPLSGTFWAEAADTGIRRAFHAIGTIRRHRDAITVLAPEERAVSLFYGRPALRVDFVCLMGDRMPGTSGAAVAAQIFSSPAPLGSRAQPSYYPLVIARLPVAMARGPRLVRRSRPRTEQFWRSQLEVLRTADHTEAHRSFVASRRMFQHTTYCQGVCLFATIQPVYDQLSKLVAAVGEIDPALLAGYGAHEETRMLADLWACSRDQLTLDQVLDRHGYHGPGEGEMSSVAWREDSAPLQNILRNYRSLDDSAAPAKSELARMEARRRAEHELLAALRPAHRIRARAVLGAARRYLPLRAVGKVAFLQSLDAARAAARRLGHHLSHAGVLDQPEDIFFLTADEICRQDWADGRRKVADRRAIHQEYQAITLPVSWQSMPEPQPLAGPTDPGDDEKLVLEGVGASAGIVDGVVRVVDDPGNADIEPGEILVARTTDPSWAAIIFCSAALVMDIGGQLSHAAVVARELGVPCVANTQNGTTMLHTGDRCRVDGTSGRVELLERP